MHCGVGVQCLRKLSFQGEFCVIVKKKTGDQSSGDNKEQNVKKKKKIKWHISKFLPRYVTSYSSALNGPRPHPPPQKNSWYVQANNSHYICLA